MMGLLRAFFCRHQHFERMCGMTRNREHGWCPCCGYFVTRKRADTTSNEGQS